MEQRTLHRCGLAALAVFVSLLPAAACDGPLDILGVESSTVEELHNRPDPGDDRIEDKHPAYDATRIVTETFDDGCQAQLNMSTAVTRLDIAPLDEADADLADLLFRGRREAAEYVAVREDARTTLIPSSAVVHGALRPFDDGVSAAIELGMQDGVVDAEGTVVYPSKRRFLHDLLAAVLALEAGATPAQATHVRTAAADLGAALILGGEDPVLPADLRTQADAEVVAFDRDDVLARPIGFHAWTAELQVLYRQDRFLRNGRVEAPVPLDPYSDAELGKAATTALALDGNPVLLEQYEGFLAVSQGLTDPFADLPVTVLRPYLAGLATLDDLAAVRDALLVDHPPPSLPPACRPHLAVFPTAKRRETSYFEARWCGGGIPAGTSLLDELVTALRDGTVDLEPAIDSGWYDYQSHALEALLRPEQGVEAQNLLLTAAYKEQRMDTARTFVTRRRETNVRQIASSDKGSETQAPEFDVYPKLPAEPFPTFYLRTARAYRFLAAYLATTLGDGFLGTVHRLREDGTRAEPALADELRERARLLYGLHLSTSLAVGARHGLLADELVEYPAVDCVAQADAWLATWRSDADVLGDPREIVRMARDEATGELIYRVVPGVRVLKARAEFESGHEPRDVTPLTRSDGVECLFRGFVPHEYYLIVDAFAQVRLPADAAPPTSAELRAICDAHRSVAGIVDALEAR